MSKYMNPKDIELSIKDMIKYDARKDPDGVIYKEMGGYVQMLVPMDNPEGHDTYEVYFRDDGSIDYVIGHDHNSGFSGKRRF